MCQYRRLHLPVNALAQTMFSHDVKRLRFRCQTLKFSHPNVKFPWQSFAAITVKNLRISLHWHIESRKSIGDFLREVDEDLSIHDGELQSNDRRGNFTFGRENFSLTPETHTFDVIENMFCAPVRSWVDAIDGIIYWYVDRCTDRPSDY